MSLESMKDAVRHWWETSTEHLPLGVTREQWLAGLIVLMLLVTSVIWVARWVRSSPGPSFAQAWYYDLNTGTFFTSSSRHGPILQRSTGSQPAVIAYLYACGSCDNPATRFGYLESIQRIDGTEVRVTATYDAQQPATALVWHPLHGPQAEALQMAVYSRCDDPDELINCLP